MFIHDTYEHAFTDWLRRFKFELFATVSLGVPYVPKDLESKLKQILKRVTGTPYQCGFYGVYSDCGTPHIHLLLASAGKPLDPRLVESMLATAFTRKRAPSANKKKIEYCYGKEPELIDSVDREHSPSVNVQKIYRIQGVLEYLCRQYPEMYKHTGNEICGNLKALNKNKGVGHHPTLSELTRDTMGDFVWDSGPISQSPGI